jgi:hypothetical protein
VGPKQWYVIVSRTLQLIAVSLLTAACAASPNAVNETPDAVDEVPVTTEKQAPLLDRTQAGVENVLTSTAQAVDNIFGSAEIEEGASVTRGRLSIGGQWDQRDGLRERLRLKARFALPALEERTSVFFGRGDVNDFVDGSGDDNIDTLPDRFNDFQDEDWLLGIGYSRDAKLRRGWSFGVGVRMKTPLEPFVRATYRWNRAFGDDWLWRLEPRVFVQSQRGAGISVRRYLVAAILFGRRRRGGGRRGLLDEQADRLSEPVEETRVVLRGVWNR